MHRISLGNLELEGENAAYLLDNGDSLTLIDTGINNSETRERLESKLDELGYRLTDIRALLVTHWHADHAGLAEYVATESGATVYAHEIDAPMVGRDDDELAAVKQRYQDQFNAWQIPQDQHDPLLDQLFDPELYSGYVDVEPLSDGETLEIGGIELRTLHSPGHTAGHLCYEYTIDGSHEAFVGDTVLPVYTPNVGGADPRVDHPLDVYVDTLRTIIERDFDRIWPGHREVIESPTARAREIISHHVERMERVLDVLREHGPASAWVVSDHLFGDLQGVHVLHGPGEAYAHLAHLERTGVVDVQDGEYRLLDEDVTGTDLL